MSSLALIYENDKEMIREYVDSGSQKAATAFVRKYQNFVYATALRYLKNETDADDASQEAFIKALSNLHKFKGNSSIKTWLYRITVNVCINMRRKKKWLSFFGDEEKQDYLNISSGDPSAQLKLEGKEFEEKFFKALEQLPDKQRETFALRYFEELSYEEISQMVGTSVGGLKANYHQAVKKLAAFLDENKQV